MHTTRRLRSLLPAIALAAVFGLGRAALAQDGDAPAPTPTAQPTLDFLDDAEALGARMKQLTDEAASFPVSMPLRDAWVRVVDDEREFLRERLDFLRQMRSQPAAPIAVDVADAARRRLAAARRALGQLDPAQETAFITDASLSEAFGTQLQRVLIRPLAVARQTVRTADDGLTNLYGERIALPALQTATEGRLSRARTRLVELQARTTEIDEPQPGEVVLVERQLALAANRLRHLDEKAALLELRGLALVDRIWLASVDLEAAQLGLARLERVRDFARTSGRSALETMVATAVSEERTAADKAATAPPNLRTLLAAEHENRVIRLHLLQWRLYMLGVWERSETLEQMLSQTRQAHDTLQQRFASRELGDSVARAPRTDIEVVLDTPVPARLESRETSDGTPLTVAQSQATARATLASTPGEVAAGIAGQGGSADAWGRVGALRTKLLEVALEDLQYVLSLEAAQRETEERLTLSRESARTLLRRESVLMRSQGSSLWATLSRVGRDAGSFPSAAGRVTDGVLDYLGRKESARGVRTATLVALLTMSLLLFVRWRFLPLDAERGPAPARGVLRSVCVGAAAGLPFFAAAGLPDVGASFAAAAAAVGTGVAGLIAGPPLASYALMRVAIATDPDAVERTRRGVARLTRVAFVGPPLALLCEAAGYDDAGVLRLLWWLVALAAAVVVQHDLLARDALPRALVGDASPHFAPSCRITRTVRSALYVCVPTLLILEMVGYGALADVLASLLLGLLGAVAGVMAAFGADTEKPSVPGTRSVVEAEAGARAGATLAGLLRSAAMLAVGFAALAAALALQGVRFGDLRRMFEIPLPFQDPSLDDPMTWWNIFAAAAVLAAFVVLSRFVRIVLRELLLPRSRMDVGLQYTIGEIARYVLLILGAYLALRELFDLSAVGYLVAALGVGVGFGLQEIVGNFVSGLILLFERPVKVGDMVEVGGVTGVINHISIRATSVQTLDNVSLLIPNREFTANKVVNYVYSDLLVRDRIHVGVAYGSDTSKVRETLLDVARRHGRVLGHPAPRVYFQAFGNSSLDFELLYWTSEPLDRFVIQSDLHFAVDAAFRREGITIPFPQRDVHMKGAGPPPALPSDEADGAAEADAPDTA